MRPALAANDVITHTPVMLEAVLQHLAVQPGGRYVDCTVGGGGHAAAILERASPGGLLLGIDADPQALKVACRRLHRFGQAVRLVEDNFRHLAAICQEHNFVPVHGILFDLGLSSLQLADRGRGFGFQVDAPLDMRFGPGQSLTAAEIINTYPEEALAELIWRYGEEPHSRRIARAIVQRRPLHSSGQLASLIETTVGRRRGRHPAVRTFQSLRIAVNDELGNLAAALAQVPHILGPGGRLVVISFHSLEDRIVKQFLRREARDCICPPGTPKCICGHKPSLKIITKGAQRPSPQEVEANPRSRSARLRAAEKL